MGERAENTSIEAEIAECYSAIYAATDPQVAMSQWVRLRKLIAQRTEAENQLFLQETRMLNTSRNEDRNKSHR